MSELVFRELGELAYRVWLIVCSHANAMIDSLKGAATAFRCLGHSSIGALNNEVPNILSTSVEYKISHISNNWYEYTPTVLMNRSHKLPPPRKNIRYGIWIRNIDMHATRRNQRPYSAKLLRRTTLFQIIPIPMGESDDVWVGTPWYWEVGEEFPD